MKTYLVRRITQKTLNINGKGDHSVWNKATIINDFSSPWTSTKPSKTEFKALWDENYLYFCFKIEDTSIHIDKTDNSFKSINVSDRVELFFRNNASLNPYYCLEIDPCSRIMDFKALPEKEFDFNWCWPKKDLVVKSNISDKGYVVEGKISINSLKKLNLIINHKIETGIFRAKYYLQNNGYEPEWITWIDPKTETPNFHTASSFGELVLK